MKSLAERVEHDCGCVGSPSRDAICERVESWLRDSSSESNFLSTGGQVGVILQSSHGSGKTTFLNALYRSLPLLDCVDCDVSYYDIDSIKVIDADDNVAAHLRITSLFKQLLQKSEQILPSKKQQYKDSQHSQQIQSLKPLIILFDNIESCCSISNACTVALINGIRQMTNQNKNISQKHEPKISNTEESRPLSSSYRRRCFIVASSTYDEPDSGGGGGGGDFHANNRSLLPSALQSLSCLGRPIDDVAPDYTQRQRIFTYILTTVAPYWYLYYNTGGHNIHEVPADIEQLSNELSGLTAGCNTSQLFSIVRNAAVKAQLQQQQQQQHCTQDDNTNMVSKQISQKICVNIEWLYAAAYDNQPAASVLLNHSNNLLKKSPATLPIVIGLSSEKDTLLLSIQDKYCKGAVLYGPSGTGKSLLIDWIHYNEKLTKKLLYVPCADIVHKIVGASEKQIKQYFTAARMLSPCILVLDNIDILLGCTTDSDDNDNMQHSAFRRILSTILIEMDEVVASEADVTIIATSAHIHTLDKGLIRPGRLETHIELHLPTENQRLLLLQEFLLKRINDLKTNKDSNDSIILESFDWNNLIKRLVQCTSGKTAADLHHLVEDSVRSAMSHAVSVETNHKNNDLMINKITKSISIYLQNFIEKCTPMKSTQSETTFTFKLADEGAGPQGWVF